MAEQRVCEAHADHVADDENRNAQPKCELCEFDPSPAEVPPRIESPDSQPEMDQHRAIQHNCDRPAFPKCRVIVERIIHCGEGDVPERMVGEMADDISKQNNAGDQPHLTDAYSAKET